MKTGAPILILVVQSSDVAEQEHLHYPRVPCACRQVERRLAVLRVEWNGDQKRGHGRFTYLVWGSERCFVF